MMAAAAAAQAAQPDTNAAVSAESAAPAEVQLDQTADLGAREETSGDPIIVPTQE